MGAGAKGIGILRESFTAWALEWPPYLFNGPLTILSSAY